MGHDRGYWLWKPYIILERVEQLAPDEVLLYSDAGRNAFYRLTQVPRNIIERATASEQRFLTGVSIPHLGTVAQWTKRDCLQLMNADTEDMHGRPMVQATWSVWTKSTAAIEFLRTWLRYAEDPRCLTDAPNELGKDNLPTFVDHRHDQSIATILTHQRKAPFVDLTGTLVQSTINLRPNSAIGRTLYKSAESVDAILGGAGLGFLARQFARLRFGK